jgi:hypothetical protein
MGVNVPLLGWGLRRKDQIPLFNDHQEEQAIDQSQQMLVVILGSQTIVRHCVSQSGVGRMDEEARAEAERVNDNETPGFVN